MKKKFVLVTVTTQGGSKTHLVSVKFYSNVKPSINQEMEMAIDTAKAWYANVHPHLKVISIIPSETISPISIDPSSVLDNRLPVGKSSKVLDGQLCYGFEDLPDTDGEDIDDAGVDYSHSVDVIIDPDGTQKACRIGYFSFYEKEWRLYSEEGFDVVIDPKHMRWVYNPLTHPDK